MDRSGWGGNGTADLRIVGSKPEYILSLADCTWKSDSKNIDMTKFGCAIQVQFDIDSQGVTPITLWGKTGRVSFLKKVA